MVNDDERCLLALSILDGEVEARQILADLLEEEGDDGLAQWARGRKGHLKKQFDIALGVLPARITVRMACEFCDHVCETLKKQYPHCEPYRQDIGLLLSWATGESDGSLIGLAAGRLASAEFYDLTHGETFQATAPPDRSRWWLGRAFTALANAAQSGLLSDQADQPRLIRHHRNEAANQTRVAAMQCREELCCHRTISGLQHYHKHASHPARNELQRQIKQLRKVLTDVVNPEQ